jgi:outer membrane protein assembly factor BamE (lipoprotein component of BamABCDE complex)
MRIILLIIFVFVANCKFDKIVNSHGVHYLDKKQKELIVQFSNKNDIIQLLGPPATKSKFNNDLWIYIERKKTRSTLLKFGKKKIFANNVLLLEIDNKGLLAKKDFFDINDMKKINFSDSKTENTESKKSFVYDFLSSMRQRMNDPLGVRKKKINPLLLQATIKQLY